MAYRPRIGISLDAGPTDVGGRRYVLGADYADRILAAGGLPVLLAHTHDHDTRLELLAGLDGLLIPGGDDLDARLWGAAQHPDTLLMDPLRQDFDLALLALAETRDLPTLGICLGAQMMNVERQGSLHQAIAQAFPESPVRHGRVHSPATCHSSMHEVLVRPGTHLHAILGVDALAVNSRHRQSVDRLGHGLIASAFAPDGILEALEDLSLTFWIGVEWHPENLPGTPHERLFDALVSAARSYHERPR